MPETRLVADEDFAWAECVSIRAAGRRVGDPLPGLRLYQLAQHGRAVGLPDLVADDVLEVLRSAARSLNLAVG